MRNYWQDVARAAEAAGWTYEPPSSRLEQMLGIGRLDSATTVGDWRGSEVTS